MPYIEKSKRIRLDKYIKSLPKGLSLGQINYIISRIVDKCFGQGNYDTLSSAIGTLDCIKNEFYDRVIRKYEDYKKDLNGEVYDLPYIAGLFDGEGNICIYKVNNNRRGYTLSVSIANTNYSCLEKVKTILNFGSIYKSYKVPNGKKQCYSLKFIQNDSLKFLKKVFPYLNIKKEEAKIAIEFQERKIRQGTGANSKWQLKYYNAFRIIRENIKKTGNAFN